MSTNKENFLKLVSKGNIRKTSNVFTSYPKKDLRKSQNIALKILIHLDKMSLSKEELSKLLNISLDELDILLTGKTKFTDTILNDLKNILKINLK